MSFGFDPLVGTILHPGNPENGVKHAIERMGTGDLTRLIETLHDYPRGPSATLNNSVEVRDRIRWAEEEIERRAEEQRGREAHRVRAEETNIFADLGEPDDTGESLRGGTVDEI